MLTTKRLTINDHGNSVRLDIIDPASTSCKPLADAARELFKAADADKKTKQRLNVARDALERFSAEQAELARQLGAEGKAPKKGDRKKRKAALVDEVDDLELESEASTANVLRRLYPAYQEILTEQAPAIAAAAKQDAESALASLATVVSVARRAGGTLGGSLSLVDALQRVAAGEGFSPRPMRARKDVSGEFMQSAAPELHIDAAIESLGTAITYASRILKDLAKADKAAKLEAEGDDDSLDHLIVDDDDDDTDDEAIYA